MVKAQSKAINVVGRQPERQPEKWKLKVSTSLKTHLLLVHSPSTTISDLQGSFLTRIDLAVAWLQDRAQICTEIANFESLTKDYFCRRYRRGSCFDTP